MRRTETRKEDKIKGEKRRRVKRNSGTERSGKRCVNYGTEGKEDEKEE